ncbi:hypothetical protein P43SY_002693 [Pythium insidiosum]|uniref:Peptidyl-prolyl cis-trans isomerase n=1 Tax=Pythium insidiosum TaxID=114742 RepID=A0AAD5MAC4_PYTIN|nr:hypothetical protein P43SY_002693 [Pythium insidiosum]
MLPRTSSRFHGGRSAGGHRAMDSRKIFLAFMMIVFVAYFAFVNVFFSFTPNAPEAVIAHERQPVNDLAAEPLGQPGDASTPSPTTKWKRNPNRKYVWIDVAIDDVYVGRVTAELYADLVPKTAENFRALTTGELGADLTFKNSVCHRILKGFIVQCGDFTTGKGYGGRSIYGQKFDDEPNGLRLTHSKRYILQMANSGPNTNGSQFCFMLGPAPHLNGHHVVFGEVIDGFEVVDKMEAAGGEQDGVPLQHKVALIDGGELL